MHSQPHRRRESRRQNPLRNLRVAQLLKEELQRLFDSELNDSNLDGTRVETLHLHGTTATVELLCLRRTPQLLSALERATPWLRVQLCESLQLERTPVLKFRVLALESGSQT